MVLADWEASPPCLSVEDLKQKLQTISHGLVKWSRDTFGSVRKEIKRLKKELEDLRADPARIAPSHNELKINQNLIEMYHREEVMWRQRSRIEWLNVGDRNTKFFHLRASIRRKKNMIKALQNSLGVVVDDPAELRALVNDFYHNLYTSEGVQNMDAVLDHVPRKVSAEMNASLCAPYTNE